MLVQLLLRLSLGYLFTWQAVAVGTTVSSLVFVSLRRYSAWRRRRMILFSTEEDLPWERMLELFKQYERELASSGVQRQNQLSSNQLLALLLSRLPPGAAPSALPISMEERQFLRSAPERRSGRRRWGNPTNVHLSSPLLLEPLHGIVINRSTGGLGIFVDREVPVGTVLEVRAIEAPSYIASAEIEIKYCAKIRRQYILGCQFCTEIPWNVRVWFG